MFVSNIDKNIPKSFKNKTEEQVFESFKKLNISFEKVDNDEAFSMEDCIEIDKKLDVEIRKSIFLCNSKKNTFFLVVIPSTKSLDVNSLSKKININKLSFASEEYMEKYLGCLPGTACISCLFNDLDDYVIPIIDKEILNTEYFGMNTGINTTHVKIKTEDLINKFIPHTKHKAKIIEL